MGACFSEPMCMGNPISSSNIEDCEAGGGASYINTGDFSCTTFVTTGGDPHYKTFHAANHYDFHGECDMVLVKNPGFANGLGLDIQIRTTRFNFFSYIEQAAIKIGKDVLEIDNKATVRFNGVLIDAMEPLTTFAGYNFTKKVNSNKGQTNMFTLHLDDKGLESVTFHIWDMFVGVFVNEGGKMSVFDGSYGMMGDYANGLMLARDGYTLVEDPATFATEWQVRNDGSDPVLFAEARPPQHPERCFLPEVTERELVTDATRSAAEKACARWSGNAKTDCIYDVIATGNLDIAAAEVY